MDINVNVLFVIAVIVMVYNVIQGYRKGMVKAVISLVSMVVLCVVVALLANAVSSYHDGKYYNLAVMVILLAVLGIFAGGGVLLSEDDCKTACDQFPG